MVTRLGPPERSCRVGEERAQPASTKWTPTIRSLPTINDGDEQQAYPKLPVTRREVGEIILQQPVDQSADEAAIEIAGAAMMRISKTSAERSIDSMESDAKA